MPMTKDEAVELLKAHADLPMGVISRQQMLEMIDMLASAIIPTPELRHASEVVCLAAEYSFDDFMSVEARATRTAVAIVRAAFKEPDNA